MTTAIRLWSGVEVRALRESQRLSLTAFAERLGVSERMVSKWEKGGAEIHPRPVNQQALDTLLATSTVDALQRFGMLLQRQDDHLAPNLTGEIVDRRLDVSIDVDPRGRVHLRYEHELENRTALPFTRMTRQFWFKHTDGPLALDALPSRDGRQVLIQRMHDVGLHVKFACQIFPALAPGETAKVGYTCRGGLFTDELYWRQTVSRNTDHLRLRLRLQGSASLRTCSATEERPDGSEVTVAESLTWSQSAEGVVIDLRRQDLRTNQSITLRWEVADAPA